MPQVPGVGGGTAVLTDPRGISGDDAGVTGSIGLPTAYGRNRVAFDLPPIGTPEHTALLSGSLDLTEIAAGRDRGPLIGFAPIVLDPAGPTEADLADVRALPEVDGASLPSPVRRRRSALAPAVRPLPPVVARARTGALGADEMRASLAALPVMPVLDDPTPTGELARPFVNETSLADWVTVDDVPPPVSVDVFQKAVRAGLDPAQAAAAIATSPDGQLPESLRPAVPATGPEGEVPGDEVTGYEVEDIASPRRTRRELRARERALSSIRGTTARRLAKGGVLAITALGVVSSGAPHTLGALGFENNDDLAAARGALDFAGALAPKLTPPSLSPEALAERQRIEQKRNLRQEMADAAVDEAGRASVIAGGAVLDLAFEQDRLMEARRRAEYARAVRDVARNPRAYAALLVKENGWDAGQFQCLDKLWQRESQWNYRAMNPSSGAYGIAQALPGSKMGSAGADWRTNPMTQIKWGLNYIENRYGTPCGAWSHSQATGWY